MSLAASANAVGAGLINATAKYALININQYIIDKFRPCSYCKLALCVPSNQTDSSSNPQVITEQEQKIAILSEEDQVLASQVCDNIKRNTPEMQRKNIIGKVRQYVLCHNLFCVKSELIYTYDLADQNSRERHFKQISCY